MEEFLKELPKLAKDKLIENKKYFQKLKKRTPKNLDVVMQDLHDKEFEKTDCLTCGNCCKTTSPIFTNKDIERISKHFKMKVFDFTTQYLELDADNFYVLKTAPCAFLDLNDNMCMIYDVRPKACSEYPHTDRRKFIQIADLTIKNTEICPAAYNIVEALKIKLPK
ncbi:YkgJ family cysteine cluster protein [Lutibacter sp. A80]|uniref:YkgJ family cysteine cluster protein n=1 Tax=Lutibacter sp. A80 TaxID=2918453 RepID=UPI001F0609CA|nr:YkgJ family cysteine cluster protein [Lutibacter sp. A80]UMB61352.1 YkgJ family cysteine cluster protein [Lutibacter sp. A80]